MGKKTEWLQKRKKRKDRVQMKLLLRRLRDRSWRHIAGAKHWRMRYLTRKRKKK